MLKPERCGQKIIHEGYGGRFEHVQCDEDAEVTSEHNTGGFCRFHQLPERDQMVLLVSRLGGEIDRLKDLVNGLYDAQGGDSR